MGKRNARLGQVRQIHVVRTNGGGAHKAYSRTGQQGGVHTGDRPHQQNLRLAQLFPGQGAAVHSLNGGKGLERLQTGHVGIGDNVHRYPWVKHQYWSPLFQLPAKQPGRIGNG